MDFPQKFQRFFLKIIRLENAISFAKIMLLERFCNVVQTFLNTKTAKFSGLRPKIRKGGPLQCPTSIYQIQYILTPLVFLPKNVVFTGIFGKILKKSIFYQYILVSIYW